jgi:hypothetical protein
LFNSDVNIEQQTVKHGLNRCMTDQTSKAIGLRVPAPLWAKIQDYGLANHPKGESFDVTQTLVTLLANALDIPLDSIVKQPSSLSDERITAIVKQEFDRLAVELRAEVKASTTTSVTTHTDFDLAATQIYIDKQIEELRADITAIGDKPVSIATMAKQPNPAKVLEEPSPEILKVIARLEKDPKLKDRAAQGINVGLAGTTLGQWLADGGFKNAKGENYNGASLSRFKAAIEHLNSIKNRA